jgi:outer membrane receptor protein involved in Fe transport
VPGLSVREGGEQTGISIRGFGTGLNFGFDQSVGMFVDGIYAGRERQFRGLFLDVAGVEVLKGPQATLFGKSTTAGAIIINTGRPSHQNSAEFGAEYTDETKQQTYRVILNGGLTDTLAGRLALRYSESDGYLYNTMTDRPEEQERDWTVRATFLWEPMDSLDVTTKLEHSEYRRRGRNYVMSRISGVEVGRPTCFPALPTSQPPCAATAADVAVPARLSIYRAYDPDFVVRSHTLSSKQLETADFETDNAMLRAEWAFSDVSKLTSITGYSAYKSDDQRDVDWSPTDYLYEPITQEFDQYSQEFQFETRLGDRFDLLTGVHWFKNDFYVDRRTDIDIRVFYIPGLATPTSPEINGRPSSDFQYASLRYLDQTTESYSAYLSGTYEFTPALKLNAGVRWSREEKIGKDRYSLSQFGSTRFLNAQLSNPADATSPIVAIIGSTPNADTERLELIRSVVGVGGILQLSRDSTVDTLIFKHWSPEVKLSWDVNDDVMLYTRYARATKPGGFNSATTGQEAPDRTFGDEKINAYEAGAKLRLFGGAANVNLAFFRQELKDQQQSVWGGDAFYVSNAGKSRAQGLEGDIAWLATNSLRFNLAFQYLDAKYIENINVACTIEQRFFGAPGCTYTPAGNGRPATYLRDLSGQRYAAKFTGAAGASYRMQLAGDLDLTFNATAVYTPQGVSAFDPTNTQPERTIVDASVALASGRTWDLALLVRNLTDKEYFYYEFEAPAQTGSRIGFSAPPRMFTLQATYRL